MSGKRADERERATHSRPGHHFDWERKFHLAASTPLKPWYATPCNTVHRKYFNAVAWERRRRPPKRSAEELIRESNQRLASSSGLNTITTTATAAAATSNTPGLHAPAAAEPRANHSSTATERRPAGAGSDREVDAQPTAQFLTKAHESFSTQSPPHPRHQQQQ